MAIRTVRETIAKEHLGKTLMHEHIFMDLRHKFSDTKMEQYDDPVTPERIHLLRKNHRLLRDNLFLADEQVSLEEIALFKELGGSGIVSMSNRGMGANPLAMRRIAQALDIHLIECTGFYTDAVHPDWMKELSIRQMADIFIHDLTEGIDDTGICAGIIGEIGTSAAVTDREWRVLSAAALAQKETGASISVHIDPWVPNGLVVLDYLDRQGANLERVVIGHVDAVLDMQYCRQLLQRGCVIELDNFGKRYETPGLHFDTDAQRMETIARFVQEGYEGQMVLSTDICLKSDLYRYGGGGYGHILRSILPELAKMNVSQDAIVQMTEKTPARLLDW